MTADGRVTLHFEGVDEIAVVTLDRPARRNALSWPMWVELAETVAEAARAEPRALVVTGAGGHFSSGMDLKPDNPLMARVMPALIDGDSDAARSTIEELKDFLGRLREFPAPTIAAIEGVAVGGGFEVALSCDIRVAARNARVGLPEVRVGLIPDLGGTALVTRLVGPGRAAAIVCAGREYSGEEALALGLVDEVANPTEAMARALALARDVARGAPGAVAEALGVVRRTAGLPIEEALAIETAAGVRALLSGEAIEGIRSFAEKRPPAWLARARVPQRVAESGDRE